MNISALDGGNAAATEIARKKLGEEAPAREKQPASPAAQEDTVNISEEGKEKAATLTMRSQDEGAMRTPRPETVAKAARRSPLTPSRKNCS